VRRPSDQSGGRLTISPQADAEVTSFDMSSVSILTPFEPCAHPLDWEVGTHGIYLSFKPPSSSVRLTVPCCAPAVHRRLAWPLPDRLFDLWLLFLQRTLNATYLPQIASEQGWTKEETLESALQKAGFRGELADVWREGDEHLDARELKRQGRGTLTVRRYRSEKSEVSWQEWVDARA
jgi:hypothetical protein